MAVRMKIFHPTTGELIPRVGTAEIMDKRRKVAVLNHVDGVGVTVLKDVRVLGASGIRNRPAVV